MFNSAIRAIAAAAVLTVVPSLFPAMPGILSEVSIKSANATQQRVYNGEGYRIVTPPASGRGSGHTNEIIMRVPDGRYFAFNSIAGFDAYAEERGYIVQPHHEGNTKERAYGASSFESSRFDVVEVREPEQPAPQQPDINVDASGGDAESNAQALADAQAMAIAEQAQEQNQQLTSEQIANQLVRIGFEPQIALNAAVKAVNGVWGSGNSDVDVQTEASPTTIVDTSSSDSYIAPPSLNVPNLGTAPGGTWSATLNLGQFESNITAPANYDGGWSGGITATDGNNVFSGSATLGVGPDVEGVNVEQGLAIITPVLDAQRGVAAQIPTLDMNLLLRQTPSSVTTVIQGQAQGQVTTNQQPQEPVTEFGG